jgi:hypothetical protein
VAQLSVPAGQTGFATAACAAGEALVSGGYSTPSVQWTPFNIESYPSDLAGTPPATQGQQASGWTVRFYNRTLDTTFTIAVTANCLRGVATGVWFVTQRLALKDGRSPLLVLHPAGSSPLVGVLPSVPRSGGALDMSLQCPVAGDFTVLTGGGWKDFAPVPVNEGVWEGAWPSAEGGVDHETWNTGLAGNRTVDSVVYVICAKGITAGTIATVHASTPPLAAVACPQGELLVGGGYQKPFAESIASSVNALDLQQDAWIAGSPYTLTLDVYAICVRPVPVT